MVANKVNIYSNGFQFKFKYNKSNPVSMIIPEWVYEVPDFIDLNQTNIILHFKPEVKDEISSYFEKIHPPLLLFLRNLKVIEIEKNDKNIVERIELSEKKDGRVEILYGEKKSYWKVIRKSFGVPPDIDEERREKIVETEIVLAFSINEDGFPETSNEQGVFAFLPVRKYGFKFIIQADFLLPITREDIIKDNKWNKWLRDSIVEVFLDAVSEFKNEEKIKYNFYDYLPLKEVKDGFFVPVVKQIYERLKEEDCVLTEANRWKKPSEVLIGNEEIKKIVTNGDLQKFFGKEYLPEKIKANKQVLHKLGIKDFSTYNLIKSLENTEWIESQNYEWFACLFRYLSKKELNYKLLKQLKNLNIIKLENGELTSISEDEDAVFFPLAGEVKYGFEDELRVIKKDIMDIISKYEKEEKDKILEFLKELGLQRADPYEIIKNHILPIYEKDKWKQKGSRILMGYIRYIKDNINKYERENDRRLNASRTYRQTKKDPLRRINSLYVRINKTVEGTDYYDHPENIYLPKAYGNDNNLEDLFEGIQSVNFVHPCYIEDIQKVKNKKEVKRIEEQIKKLEDEKNKKISEWKKFFIKIGVWNTLIVKKDPYTEIYQGGDYANNEVTKKVLCKSSYCWDNNEYKENTIWKDELWNDTDLCYYIGNDWFSDDFRKIIEKIRKKPIDEKIKFAGQLCNLIDRYWQNRYKQYIQCDYYRRYSGQQGWSKSFTKSTFCLNLRNNIWLPTSLNTLAKPSEVFLDKPEIRNVLGDTAPYLTVEIKNEDFISILGINTQADVKSVLNYLKALIEQKNKDIKKFMKLYKFLDDHFEKDSPKIKEEFAKNSLIFVPDTDKKYSIEEFLWEDVSNVFGKNRIYLKNYYLGLKKFFVEKLGISEKPTPKDYVNVMISISEKSKVSDEDKEIILKIYEELNHNLDPSKVENPISQEDWWDGFIKKSIFLTNKEEFWFNERDVFVNDDNELYDLFKDNEDIGFLWLPDGYHPDKIKFFIVACGLHYISERTEKSLLEGDMYSKDEKLTHLIQNIILPYVSRYLYWKENSVYEKLKENEEFEKIMVIEVYVTDNLKVKYSININEWKKINKVDYDRVCILYNNSLYILKDNANLYYLAIEFSKRFGEIKEIGRASCRERV